MAGTFCRAHGLVEVGCRECSEQAARWIEAEAEQAARAGHAPRHPLTVQSIFFPQAGTQDPRGYWIEGVDG